MNAENEREETPERRRDVALASRERLAAMEGRRRSFPKGLVIVALLLLLVALGPSAGLGGAFGRAQRSLGFGPAFSVEPTATVQITAPQNGSPVGRYVAIEATAMADMGVTAIRVVADGQTVHEVEPSSRPTAWRMSAVWDSVHSDEGTAAISVTTEDAGGRTAEDSVTVRVDHTPPDITYSVPPDRWALSPNGDGSKDVFETKLEASEPVRVTAVVSDGALGRTVTEEATPTKTATIVWDGRYSEDGDTPPVQDGAYPLSVTVVDRAGNAVETTQAVLVDRVPPSVGSVKMARASFWPAKKEAGGFTIDASDDSGKVSVGLVVSNQAPSVVRTVKAGPKVSGSQKALWDGRYANGRIVPPGEYETTVTVSDMAGNTQSVKGDTLQVHALQKPRTIVSIETTEKVVALTFDDLYRGDRTNEILDILERYEAKATFFAVGQAAGVNEKVMRRIIEDGHSLGNHSQSHPVMPGLPYSGQVGELTRAERSIRAATGHTTAPLFRPPYGATDGSVAKAAGQTEHPYVFLWDVDTLDWASPGVARIIANVRKGVGPGSIVLMHGGPPQTPKALPTILKDLRKKGYRTVTLPELLWLGGYR